MPNPLHRLVAYTRALGDTFGWRYLLFITFVYGVNQALAEGWMGFARKYYFSDDPPKGLGLQPSDAGAFMGLITVPWQIKSIYGILSDAVAWRRLHRTPYLIFAGLIGTVAWLVLGTIPMGVGFTSVFLLFANYSIASPDVMVDASVAERCKIHPHYTSDLQSLCWGAFGVGSIVSSISAGFMYDSWIGARGMFFACSVTSVGILVPSLYNWIGEHPDTRAEEKYAAFKQLLASLCRRKSSRGRFARLDEPGPAPEHRPQSNVPKLHLGAKQTSSSSLLQEGANDALSASPSSATSLLGEDSGDAGTRGHASSVTDHLSLSRHRGASGTSAASLPGDDDHNGNLFILSILLCVISVSIGLITSNLEGVGWVALFFVVTVISVCYCLRRFEYPVSRSLCNASMYIFLSGAIQPTSTVLYYWEKETPENCGPDAKYGSRPCFSAEFISAMQVLGYVFMVIATVLYNMYFSKWSYRRIWFTTQLALVFANLLDFVWVMRWNLAIGIPDKIFVVGDEVVGDMIGRLNTMPLFVLAAKLCPTGYEATLFAMNMGLSNFGSVMGEYLGTILLKWMTVESPAMANIELYILIRSLSRVLPVFLIPYLVPRGSPMDHVDEEAPASSGVATASQSGSELELEPVLAKRLPESADLAVA